MKIVEAELDKYIKTDIEKLIKKLHRRETKILADLDTAEERECSITTLWNKTIQEIENHAIDIIQSRAELQKCINSKSDSEPLEKETE